jgi:hypothetical protein
VICAECDHDAGFHNITVGCTYGWKYDEEGMVATDGCDCDWAHVHLSMKGPW